MKTITINEWHSAEEIKPWEGRPCLVESETGLLYVAIWMGTHWVEVNTGNSHLMSGIQVKRFFVFPKPQSWFTNTDRLKMYSEAWARKLKKGGSVIKVTTNESTLFFPSVQMAILTTGDTVTTANRSIKKHVPATSGIVYERIY